MLMKKGVDHALVVGYLEEDTADEVLCDLNKVAEGEQRRDEDELSPSEREVCQREADAEKYDEPFNGGVK